MTDLQPQCAAAERPHRLFDPTTTVHGLRAARAAVVGGQRVLDVWLYQAPPPELADPSAWSVLPPPGAATVEVTAAGVDGDHLRLALAGLPDPTRYRLQVDPPAGLELDPLRVRLPVRLRPECPDLGSCFDTEAAPRPVPRSPVHDLTARDWRSLRDVLVELHRRRRPDADTSPADPTVTIAELFAHVGDLLHYRLDRVATEAYLATARNRTSVARHARLLDHLVADAVAARTVVHLSVPPGRAPVPVPSGARVVPADDTRPAFVVERDVTVVDALGEIAVHDWGEGGCCLPAGATSAVLVRPLPADPLGPGWLTAGDLIAFEVVDPGPEAAHDAWRTRLASWPQVAGADAFRAPLPSRPAQVVALTAVAPIADPLAPTLDLFEVTWAAADALVRPYPVSPDRRRGAPETTVVRGTLTEAHHGDLVTGGPGETVLASFPDWADRLPPEERSDVPEGYLLVGATEGLARRADGTPYLLDVHVGLPSGGSVAADPVGTHLGVPPGHLAVTVEEEPWRAPLLRFRTGVVGTDPPAGSTVTASYEAGGGTAANVPAQALTRLQRNVAGPTEAPGWVEVPGVAARNVVPAAGGAEPEPLDRVRRGAPQSFATIPRRAVLPGDHAAAAREVPGVDRATARREWSGAWPVVTTIVDVLDTGAPPDLRPVVDHLEGVRLLGQEVAVVLGTGVGLVIGLDVCVHPGVDAELVRRRIVARLRPGTSDAPGLFHPDGLRLGGSVHTSAVVAAAASVAGVDAVEVTTARRLAEPDGTLHAVLTFEQDEIPVLDDDAARPERGRLEVTVRGGR